MRPLSSLTLKELNQIKLLSFDADGVLIERGTEVAEIGDKLSVKTKVVTPQVVEKLSRLKQKFHINITSGRSLLYLNRMFAPVLWEKASIQGENGLFTLIDGQVLQHDKISAEELTKIEQIRAEINKLVGKDKNIKGFEPKQFIISIHCHEKDNAIEEIVRRIDTNNEFSTIWVSNEAYDIYLKRFGKGTGLKFLADYLKLDLSETLAVGNDMNDKPMLDLAGIAVTTNPGNVPAHFQTEAKLNLGGEEVINKLLEAINV